MKLNHLALLLSRRIFLPILFILISAYMVWNNSYAQESLSISTVYGPVNVPTEVNRVVVLDEGALDTALSVGVQPIGALASRGGNDIARYLQGYVTEKINIVGTVREPNLEAIYRLKPDLILASSE